MTKKERMHLREMLLKDYREIGNRLSRLALDWKNLRTPEIELAEEAQKAEDTSLFRQLDDRSYEETKEIDLALYKMTAGKYGLCEGCGKAISLKRLKAVPTARLCRKCAHSYENQQKELPQTREIIEPTELPVGYQNLNDRELKTAILETIKNDGRIDLEEIGISCCKGVVYLEGIIPSETEHQIMLRILTDVMGFASVVDHLRINELVWEREDITPGTVDPGPTPYEQLLYDEEPYTENIFESEEDDIPFDLPERVPPERIEYI